MMDQLETQVSDLRSFLPPPPVSAASPMQGGAGGGVIGGGGGGAGGHGLDIGSSYSPDPQQQQQQQQHHPASHHHSPLSAPGDNSAQQQQRQQTFSPGGGVSNKRKTSDEDSAKQQRSKRNRYISIACNECKRRKIKCNGQTPCQRCGNLNLQCHYAPNCCSNNFKDSDEFRGMTDHVTRLQEQVETLFNNMNALRQETLRLAPIQDRTLPLPPTTVASSPSASSVRSLPRPPAPRAPPPFSGPTSMTFTVDVAKNTLHKMGYPGAAEAPDDNGGAHDDPPLPSPFLNSMARSSLSLQSPPADPLWDLTKDEMIRLCRCYEEEVGIMYPVVNIELVVEHAQSLGAWMENARKKGLAPPTSQDDGITDLLTCNLKIVICCALAVEEHGNSARAIQLYESMQAVVDRMLMTEAADVMRLPFLALVAGYRFLANEEILAWRVMGQVVRLCLELGLHRRDGLSTIRDEQSRRYALNTFWSAYVLDRRWSFGTGLPYVCHDDKIDPKLPMPETHPYLVAMITYSRLGAKIWKLVDYFEPALIRELKRGDFEALDREILDWYETVPEEIRVASLNQEGPLVPIPSSPSYNIQRLQIWTRLRLNQIRIWLHTPVLHSASSIVENMPLAQRAVDLAKDTIEYLSRLNRTTNMYKSIQVFYHQFLTSAIAVLFLASTHAPLQFSANCRAEFYMALDLVKDMSARSWVSQRLWRTIRSLESYAPSLGLQEEDAHSTAALAMTGLAGSGHPPSGPGPSNGPNNGPSNGPGPGPGPGPVPSNSASPAPPGFTGRSTPHGGSSAASAAAAQKAQQQITEDHHNGLRLQTKMSKIFEGYTGMNGRQPPLPRVTRSPNRPPYAAVSPGGLSSPDDGLSGGVYQQFKDMF